MNIHTFRGADQLLRKRPHVKQPGALLEGTGCPKNCTLFVEIFPCNQDIQKISKNNNTTKKTPKP